MIDHQHRDQAEYRDRHRDGERTVDFRYRQISRRSPAYRSPAHRTAIHRINLTS
jgi:hypothetical protein